MKLCRELHHHHVALLIVNSLTCFSLSSLPRRRNAGILPSLEDLLFYTVAEGQETIPAHKFLTVSLSSPSVSLFWTRQLSYFSATPPTEVSSAISLQ